MKVKLRIIPPELMLTRRVYEPDFSLVGLGSGAEIRAELRGLNGKQRRALREHKFTVEIIS